MAAKLQEMASAGSVEAQEAFSLEVCGIESAASICLAGLGSDGRKSGAAWQSLFGSFLATFPKFVFFGGLGFGTPEVSVLEPPCGQLYACRQCIFVCGAWKPCFPPLLML